MTTPTTNAARYVLDYADEAPTLLRVMPAGGRVVDVARASRTAAEAFLVAAERWTKRELALWLMGDRPEAVLFALLTVLLWIMHRANIARLVNGTEGKIGAPSGA